MRNYIIIAAIALTVVMAACKSKENVMILKIENPIPAEVTDQIVKIDLKKLNQFSKKKLAAFTGGKELPSQLIDSHADGTADQFSFLIDMKAKETKTVIIREPISKTKYLQRAHAEVSEKRDYKIVNGVYTGGHFESVKKTTTPPGHIDHNYYYKCEGPCWESDKVGYRLYLDWRNSTDIYGKKIPDIVLPDVGHTKDSKGHDSYHTMADWGMDIFKVGNSLGIGTFGAWVDDKVEKVSKTDSTICSIINDGPIFASLNIKYFGWNIGREIIDLNSSLSISAGSRLTHCSFNINSKHQEFCTGLAKHENTELILPGSNDGSKWNYIALWGKQSLAGPDDKIGIALFYKSEQLVKVTEDDLSNIVVLHPTDKNIDYYFAACWQQEPGGIKNFEEFKIYLKNIMNELNNPKNVSQL